MRTTQSNQHKVPAPSLTLRIDTSKLFVLANTLGACTLNGQAAQLDRTENGRLAMVRTMDGRASACFNWSTAAKVVTYHGGRFRTREYEAECDERAGRAAPRLSNPVLG